MTARPPGARSGVRWGVVLAQLLVLAMAAVMLGRLWYLQVPMADHYQAQASENRVQELSVPAARGGILDSSGHTLVGTTTNLVVSADYHALGEQEDGGQAVLEELAAVLDEDPEELSARMRLCGGGVERPCWPGSPYQPVTLADDVEPERVLQILERQEDFPGISADRHWRRDYPHGELAAQVVGYLQPVTQEELEAREELRTQFTGVDLVGRDGVEASYDEQLRGVAGSRRLAVDAQGNVTGVVSDTAPEPGNHLVTSIDAEVQRLTEAALERGIADARAEGNPAETAAAVVMDVHNGGIVAMASLPSYDPGVWDGGIDQDTYEDLLSQDAGEPLTSRAVQGLYPPGSTFKISSLAGAVEDGYSLHSAYGCPGSYMVGDREFENYEGGAHGTISLHRALVVSCNTIFYRFAYEQWLRDGGIDPVDEPREAQAEMARGFGFGTPTGIDLPEEPAGRIPDRTWKQEYWEETQEQACDEAEQADSASAGRDPRHADYLRRLAREHCAEGYVWRAGDAANFAIGQGDVLVSPLQLATAYAALANGGTVYEPRIGKALVSADGEEVTPIEPAVAGEVPAESRTLAYMRNALAEVTTGGTAGGAFDGFPHNKVAVAGKTGTSTQEGREASAFFASYAPADDPRLAVVVVIPEGGTGGSHAAPVVREIYEGIYGLGGEEPALAGGEPPEDLPEVEPDGTVVPLEGAG
jgi:penicillin-binding protein 2